MGWKRKVLDEAPAPASPARTAPDASAAPPPPRATRPPTRIEPGCEIEGTLTLEGPLVVEGEFRGAIICRGDVVVTETGAVQATIRGRTVIVRGAVVGDVDASRELVLAPSARLHGAVDTPSLVVERGAFFQGATRMYRPEQAARAGAGDATGPAPAPHTPEPPAPIAARASDS